MKRIPDNMRVRPGSCVVALEDIDDYWYETPADAAYPEPLDIEPIG